MGFGVLRGESESSEEEEREWGLCHLRESLGFELEC
jgi:hypothetical protein